MRTCALRARFLITTTRRITEPQGIWVQKRNVGRRCRMANALQVRERCLAFEAYGAYASRAEWRRGRIRRRTKRYCVWHQCSARGTRTEAITLQAEGFIRERIVDMRKGHRIRDGPKPTQEPLHMVARLALIAESVRSVSPQNRYSASKARVARATSDSQESADTSNCSAGRPSRAARSRASARRDSNAGKSSCTGSSTPRILGNST